MTFIQRGSRVRLAASPTELGRVESFTNGDAAAGILPTVRVRLDSGRTVESGLQDFESFSCGWMNCDGARFIRSGWQRESKRQAV